MHIIYKYNIYIQYIQMYKILERERERENERKIEGLYVITHVSLVGKWLFKEMQRMKNQKYGRNKKLH